jgi:IMP cyclohydrolase
MYRVSSRSFPNRMAVERDKAISIVPKPGHEKDVLRNPYIAYNCLRIAGTRAVATNGAQTDPVAEKLETGMAIRDALVSVLHALDFEHDDYDTPRIAAVVDNQTREAYLGIVRRDALLVRSFELEPGLAYYVCTYEHNCPCGEYADRGFDASSAAGCCEYVLGKGAFADLERPITAVCALGSSGGGYSTATMEANTQELPCAS